MGSFGESSNTPKCSGNASNHTSHPHSSTSHEAIPPGASEVTENIPTMLSRALNLLTFRLVCLPQLTFCAGTLLLQAREQQTGLALLRVLQRELQLRQRHNPGAWSAACRSLTHCIRADIARLPCLPCADCPSCLCMQSARGRFPTLHVLGLLDQIERLQIAYEYGPGGRTHERGRRRLAAPLAMGCVHAFRAVTVLHPRMTWMWGLGMVLYM